MKSRRTFRAGIAAFMAPLLGAGPPKSFATKWQGVMRKSVALQDHRGACNPVKKHKESQACARRIRQGLC